MKRKVRVTDTETGKSEVSEKELRNEMHFEVQLRTRMHVFKNKKKYTRKEKHKKF